MKTLFTRKYIKRQSAANHPSDEGGLCLNLTEWKELETKLSAPPSDALRRFMATPSTVSDELEQILLGNLGVYRTYVLALANGQVAGYYTLSAWLISLKEATPLHGPIALLGSS